METTTRNHSWRIKLLYSLILLTTALGVSAQVQTSNLKDIKAFTTVTSKGKLGKFKAQKVKGKISGMGALLLKNGSLYYGDLFDSELHGKGTLISVDEISNCPGSQIYVGRFKNGLKNGKGRCYTTDGELVYEGKFKDDAPIDSYPNINTNSGSEYYFTEIKTDDYRWIGEFSGDMPDGPVIYAFDNGDLYITTYKNGEQNGVGVFIQLDGAWMLEKVENQESVQISSSEEYETLKKTAKANFRAAMSEALGYFAAAAQKGAETVSYAQSISSNNSSYREASSNYSTPGTQKNSSDNSSVAGKYDLSEQQHYNRDKSTYNRYDSMLAKAFAGNGSVSQSEIKEWQNQMRNIRQKWESKGRNFPHSANEDK